MRSGTGSLTFDLDLPEGTIPIGVTTETDLDIHISTLDHGDSLIHDEKKELGIFLGLDLIALDATIEGRLAAAPKVKGDIADASVGTPFPTAGVFFNWAFGERLALWTRFQSFGLSVGEVLDRYFAAISSCSTTPSGTPTSISTTNASAPARVSMVSSTIWPSSPTLRC
ncbi:MAG: hypothetical protein OEM49_01975 [Myxococcales bacterium]|nr:hypothetical protein [Myxococcales bacterium]MDH5566448.1 hypothetical protein [Myxococcales bacterium]